MRYTYLEVYENMRYTDLEVWKEKDGQRYTRKKRYLKNATEKKIRSIIFYQQFEIKGGEKLFSRQEEHSKKKSKLNHGDLS